MLIGFVGDVHGQVFHAIALLATWQREARRRFDLVIQLGDMGCDPDLDRVVPDPIADPYLALDPAQADFARLLKATGRRAAALRRLREQFAGPIHFLRGNHEPFSWLRRLPVDPATGTVRVDPFDITRYVADGTILRAGAFRIAIFGGVEEQTDEAGFDARTYQALLAAGTGAFEVLAAHEGHYGTSVGYRGAIHGSRLMTRLVEGTQPAFFLFAHAHKLIGPGAVGRTTYLGLDGLVASRRWFPDADGFQPGCLAVLDTDTGRLWPVHEPWMARFNTRTFPFDAWAEGFLA